MIPKFRVWDNKRKLMIDDVVVIDLYHEYIGYLYSSEIVQGEIVSRLPINDVIIMQSTGLKDIHGVEICEGDIVKVTDDYGDTNFSDGGIGTICGLDDLYMWYIDGQVHNGLYDIDQCYYIEVIGNIYKTPELLGDKYD